MNDLTQIEPSELYDLLANQTNRYMKMLSQGATRQEFDQCRDTMIAIQAEIKSRAYQRQLRGESPATPNSRVM